MANIGRVAILRAYITVAYRDIPYRGTVVGGGGRPRGELLRRIRESRGLSQRELSERTKIALAHIENIEADHYGALPVTVYLRGFLMSMARELKLDPLKVSKSYLELVAKAKQKG